MWGVYYLLTTADFRGLFLTLITLLFLNWYQIVSIKQHITNVFRIVSRRLNSTDTLEKNIDVKKIRNFSIVAHVDHGKSTLADRLLEITGSIKPGVENAQVLDQLQVSVETQ